jgi:hypothetical protein
MSYDGGSYQAPDNVVVYIRTPDTILVADRMPSLLIGFAIRVVSEAADLRKGDMRKEQLDMVANFY